jgi:hypothetical protein
VDPPEDTFQAMSRRPGAPSVGASDAGIAMRRKRRR